jgi:hypothetical protein
MNAKAPITLRNSDDLLRVSKYVRPLKIQPLRPLRLAGFDISLLEFL